MFLVSVSFATLSTTNVASYYLLNYCCLVCACDIGTVESSKGICETCPSGFYQNDIRQTKCVECASGESYVDAKTACRACDIGTFESSKGICETCPSGFYQNDICQTKCVECALGESYINAKTACRACDIGTFESSKGICEDCPTGFISRFQK